MDTEHSKPGDTIEITVKNDFFGQKFLVIECPDDNKKGPYSKYAWVEHNGCALALVDPKTYKIIKTSLENNVSDDEFLKRQLNDNLRGIFA